MSKLSYAFPAILSYADDGITITFPDIPGCISEAQSDEEAINNATEALELWLASSELDKEPLLEPSQLLSIVTKHNERAILVTADMINARCKLKLI